jgi:hypothetical protein
MFKSNPRISNLTSKSIPFGISAPKEHSHSLAPCAPAFLVGETGRWRRVPRNVGQALLYSPPSGHPRDSPLGHPPRPTLRRAPVRPPRRPSTLCWAPARVPVCPTLPPSTVAPLGHSVGPLHHYLR